MATEHRQATQVQSVGRALDILESLASSGPQGVVDLGRAVGLPQGTTHRLLTTLLDRGYVRQDAERRYALGLAGTRLADRASRTWGQLAQPVLAELVGTTGETANLAILDGDRMTYVAQVASPQTLRIFAEVGRRVPIHSTAVGKAVAAALPAAALAELSTSLTFEARTAHTISSQSDWEAAIRTVQSVGYAIDEQEQEIGVRCVAVGVPGLTPPLTGVRAAISVSGPAERFTTARVREIAPLLAPAAEALAAVLAAD